jgi:hypothetical protein
MFGNVLGWIISAVIAVAGVFGGYELTQISQPTAPTGWVHQTVQPLTMTELAKTVLDPMTNLGDNAGDLYRHAIADYQNHTSQYQDLQSAQNFNQEKIDGLAGMNDLVKAAGCPAMDLFKSKPDEIVGFNTNVDALDDLQEIARATANIAMRAYGDKNYDAAHTYSNALAALGLHLYQERIAYAELSAGEDDLGTGIGGLIEIDRAKQDDLKLGALKQFDEARKAEYSDRIEPVVTIITGESQADIGEHAGDMFQLAGDPTLERVWRVEAIRKVGRLRFNAENGADQLKAPRFLQALAADATQDPVIRATATRARDMTSSDNQSQR